MPIFIYKGPPSSMTLVVDNQDVDVVLSDGAEVDLPASHQHVLNLIEQGLLRAVPESQPKAQAKPVAVKGEA